MTQFTAQADTLIVLSAEQATFYEFLKPRQESSGGTLVVLDRRQVEQAGADAPPEGVDRRSRTPEAALALMSVLGFMILHRDGEAWTI